MSKHPCRRTFLKAGIGFIGGTGATFLFSDFESAVAHVSPHWRYCVKCQSLFYDGSANRGVCPAGGGHQAAGYIFAISYDERETPTAQDKWRECTKCLSMFYKGWPGSDYYNKGGVCPAGGTHTPGPSNYVIPHDIPETSTRQDKWRYCVKCQSMFYQGWPGSNYYKGGICPAGGAHSAAGFNFVLPYESTGYPPQNPSQNPPPSSPPVISVEQKLVAGAWTMSVGGSGFSKGQSVVLTVTVTSISAFGRNQSTDTPSLQADYLGQIRYDVAMMCSFGIRKEFAVQARDVLTGRTSNVAGTSC